jgi:hypothetical protein
MKACNRLHTQLSLIYTLKHHGFTQFELCQIILKVLTLLSATISVTVNKSKRGSNCGEGSVQQSLQDMAIDDDSGKRSVELHFDNMGCILGGHFTNEEQQDSMLKLLDDGRRVSDLGDQVSDSDGYYHVHRNYFNNSTMEAEDVDSILFQQAQQQLEHDLSRQLALPSPAREALLSIALLLLSKKDQLKSVSSAAIFTNDDNTDDNQHNNSRWMLILNWQSLLQMLLRTAPYLDEHKSASPPKNSDSRSSIVLKRTVQLIRSCRRFFDQGIRPPRYTGSYTSPLDDTANCLWEHLKSDLLYHSHSNSCFRSLILLYLFHPSKCSSSFYEKVMPLWLNCWRNIDRCPEYDFLWLVLFCRARKYVVKHNANSNDGGFDWGELRKYLLTMSEYWLQLPTGGMSADKSFPRAFRATKRSFPRSLKAFVGADSKYEEGKEILRLVIKFVV